MSARLLAGHRSERALALASFSAVLGAFSCSSLQRRAPPECQSFSWWRSSESEQASSDETPARPRRNSGGDCDGRHPRLYSPLSPIRIFRPNPNLEIAFDVRSKNPLYVLERLDPYSSSSSRPFAYTSEEGGENRGRPRHRFYESTLLPEEFRSRNSSYHRSGYDRGHLAAAANYASPRDVLDTYNLCNVSPQHPRLNSTVWVRLEEWTRRVAVAHCNGSSSSDEDEEVCDTYVVTGPLWLPARALQIRNPRRRLLLVAGEADDDSDNDGASKVPSPPPAAPATAAAASTTDATTVFEYQFPAIGAPPNLVSVPTHFFKLVAVVRRRNPRHVPPAASPIVAHACFVVPNRNVLEEKEGDEGRGTGGGRRWASFEDGLVRWTDLEAATGLEFFSELVDRDWKRAADDALVGSGSSRRRIQQQQQLLLLPPPPPPPHSSSPGGENGVVAAEGAPDKSRRKMQERFRPSKLDRVAEVAHLCPGGSCPRY